MKVIFKANFIENHIIIQKNKNRVAGLRRLSWLNRLKALWIALDRLLTLAGDMSHRMASIGQTFFYITSFVKFVF